MSHQNTHNYEKNESMCVFPLDKKSVKNNMQEFINVSVIRTVEPTFFMFKTSALFLILFFLTNNNIFGTTFYLTTLGAPTAQSASRWNSGGIGGGGTAATNFTTNGDIFIVDVGTNGIVSANMTFGSGSAATGVTLIVNGQLTINSLKTLTLAQNSTGTTSMTVNGTIIFSGASANQLVGTIAGGGTAANNTFTLASGATLKTINTSGIVSSSGTLSINSTNLTVSQNAGAKYEFNGSSAQVTLGLPATVANLTINNSSGVTLSASTSVTGTLTLTAGAFATAGLLTLASSSTGTANVAALGGTASITGNVTVQTYIPAGTRQYRMLSSPVGSFTYAQLINNIFFTGPGGATNGFDATPLNNYTGYTYQESPTRGWVGVGNITNSLSTALGMLIFIRGDRTLATPDWYTSPYVSQNAVTLNYAGTLNTGSISPTVTYTSSGDATADGWNLVGNPYASQINWSSLTKTNLSAFYYILNPATGSYVSDNGTTPIAAGQSFFVQATGSSPAITFTESAKTSASPTNYFKAAQQKIAIQMVKDSVNSDVAWIEFKSNASAGYNPNEDAVKFYNSVVNFGVTVNHDSIDLQYNTTPILSSGSDTFRLFVFAELGNYHLLFNGLNGIDPSKQILLLDSFTNTIINLRTHPDYLFSITSNPLSMGMKRLYLIIHSSATLTLKWIKLSAEKSLEGKDVSVQWTTAAEQGTHKFIVQRSNTNDLFNDLAEFLSAGNSTEMSTYSYLDKNILVSNANDKIFYRIKEIDMNGSENVSNIIWVENGKAMRIITVNPNPANDLISISNLPDQCVVEMFNNIGKCLQRKSDCSGTIQMNLSLNERGVIFVKVSNLKSGEITSIKVFRE